MVGKVTRFLRTQHLTDANVIRHACNYDVLHLIATSRDEVQFATRSGHSICKNDTSLESKFFLMSPKRFSTRNIPFLFHLTHVLEISRFEIPGFSGLFFKISRFPCFGSWQVQVGAQAWHSSSTSHGL